MTTVHHLPSVLAGLGVGLGLIVAIGAQNAFVLRQGIRHEHVLAVVLVCIASDGVLIAAGVGGAGALFTAVPWLVTIARWGGALFLFCYAVLAARRALHGPDPDAEGLRIDAEPVEEGARQGEGPTDRHSASATGTGGAGGAGGRYGVGTSTLAISTPASPAVAVPRPRGLLGVVGTALALTWLNPHVYLDTVVLLGSVGSAQGEARWAFAAGAILGSTLWFAVLGLAARALAPVFARPFAWRVLDGIIAVVMAGVATALLLGS